MNPTNTQEDYLRAIYLLEQKNNGPTKAVQLVKKLNLSKSTIAQRLKEMRKKGWINHQRYGPVALTKLGKKIAENITYKHRLMELFLCNVLNFAAKDAHKEANKLEHAMSNQVAKQIAKLLKNPTCCPHGERLPPFHEDINY